MNKLSISVLALTLFASGLAVSTQALAERGYGPGMRHMGGHMYGYKYGKYWMRNLTDAQRNRINRLRLDYKKKKYALKAKLKTAKIELAMLVTKDKPSMNAINKKIDQIVGLKRQKMRLKYGHKVAVRRLLNADQQVMFDMHVVKKAVRGKRRCRWGH